MGEFANDVATGEDEDEAYVEEEVADLGGGVVEAFGGEEGEGELESAES